MLSLRCHSFFYPCATRSYGTSCSRSGADRSSTSGWRAAAHTRCYDVLSKSRVSVNAALDPARGTTTFPCPPPRVCVRLPCPQALRELDESGTGLIRPQALRQWLERQYFHLTEKEFAALLERCEVTWTRRCFVVGAGEAQSDVSSGVAPPLYCRAPCLLKLLVASFGCCTIAGSTPTQTDASSSSSLLRPCSARATRWRGGTRGQLGGELALDRARQQRTARCGDSNVAACALRLRPAAQDSWGQPRHHSRADVDRIRHLKHNITTAHKEVSLVLASEEIGRRNEQQHTQPGRSAGAGPVCDR